ncbi:MAG: GNAT family N-acetyltransferase [Caulobacter sp.]|nr:GNAT family N-acetyltransferase [Caulobacter sp.]
MLTIRQDDLADGDVRALLALHLSGMQENTPPEHVFALDLSGLQTPDITVWTVREAGALAGIGALRALGDGTGEVKSMRTHPDHLRKGAAAALLDHIVSVARARGYWRLSLETGVGESFDAALALYRKRGYAGGEAFADYTPSAFNQFLHLALRTT